MIISLHIPKTAGKSFKKALTIEYGSSIFFDYRSNPQRSYSIFQKYFSKKFKKYQVNSFPKETKIIHGHFCLDNFKYFPQKVPRICFARDPLSLLISFYDYVKIKAKTVPEIRQYYKEVIDSSLEEFLFSPHAQKFYSKMFGSFDYHKFSFIGIVERYEESIQLFNKMFCTSLNSFHVNKTDSNKNKMCRSKFSKDFLNQFRDFHKFNYEFYKYALSNFENKF